MKTRARTMLFIICGSFFVCLPNALSEVVARVSGSHAPIEITADRLAQFAAQNPSLSPKTCLDRLIEFELLAQRAQQSESVSDALVLAAGKRVMVRKYLKDQFEPKWAAENLPDDLLRRSYEQNKIHFVHPELRIASHIIVTQKNKRPTDPKLDRAAKDLAQEIYHDLIQDTPPSAEAFRKRADDYKNRVKSLGLEVLGQNLRRFAQKGRYDPVFTEQVFSTEKVQGLLPPFVTRFGYHVVWLSKVIPAKNETFESVKDRIRARIVPEVRRMKLLKLTDKLAEALPKLNPAPGARGLVNVVPLLSLDTGEGTAAPTGPATPSPQP